MSSEMDVPKNQLLVFTDLDGTLLDHETYRWDAATETLDILRKNRIPLILCSSKTLAEMSDLAQALGTLAPIIGENGGFIACPVDHPSAPFLQENTVSQNYKIAHYGLPRETILERLEGIRRQFQFRFEGFSNWTPHQLSKHTNLSLESSQRALQRYATEPILWQDTDAKWRGFEDALTANELVVVQGGRFSHVMGATDKADGMTRVLDLYQAYFKNSSFTTIAVGDSPNDIGMLERADIGVVIPNPYNTQPLELNRKKCVRALAPGPRGWNSAVSDVVHEFYQSTN